MGLAWQTWLIEVVRGMRRALAWISAHTLWGVPLDWPVRAVLLMGLYAVVRSRLRVQAAVVVCVAVLACKELLDIFAHLELSRPRAPDTGDLADILTGLAGIAAAFGVDRWWTAARRHVDH